MPARVCELPSSVAAASSVASSDLLYPGCFGAPPPLPRRIPSRGLTATAIPNDLVQSTRMPISRMEPLEPEPLPTPTSTLMPSLLGYDAPLFHCHCTPKCIEFVRPRDHPQLQHVGSALQPLRTRVVASGPTGGRHTRSSMADFDVDCRVAYEFNDVGFYAEMLAALATNYNALITANERSQAFLHRMREKVPLSDFNQPRVYKPYYPTQHGQSFVAPPPLKNARHVAASTVAPIVAPPGSTSGHRTVEEIEADLMRQAEETAAALAHEGALPSHLRADGGGAVEERGYQQRVQLSHLASSRATFDPTGARAKLAEERARFQRDMIGRMVGKMSIAPKAAEVEQQPHLHEA